MRARAAPATTRSFTLRMLDLQLRAPIRRRRAAAQLEHTGRVYDGHRLDFADAYLVACAERTGVEEVASFDRAIDRVGTVRRVEST
jgi:predicted nucleic acid-binding protein